MNLRLLPISALLLGFVSMPLASCKDGAEPSAAKSESAAPMWLTDFEAAKAESAKSGKPMLIDFTGSDWCIYCIQLQKEVFQYDTFKDGVKDKFVLVKIDVPNDKSKQSPETIKQNAMLVERYQNPGFPTILLTDAEGIPFASTSYREGGPMLYVNHLNELLANRKMRDDNFAAAEKAQGAEKAKLLFSTLEKMKLSDAHVSLFYSKAIEQIKASDPQDESGYAKKEAAKKRMQQFVEDLNGFAARNDLEGGLAFVEKTLKDGGMSAENTQEVTLTKGLVLSQLARYDEAFKTVEEARGIAPDSEVAANIDQLVERIRERKAKGGQPGQ